MGVLLIVYCVRSFFILDLLLIWLSFNEVVAGLISPKNLLGAFFSCFSLFTVLLRLLSYFELLRSFLPAFLRTQSWSPFAASRISKSNISSTSSLYCIFPSSLLFLALVFTQNRFISIALIIKLLGSWGYSYLSK